MTNVFAKAAITALYKTDGTGRDTYIYNNSGGFTLPYEPSYSPPVGNNSYFK
jgi:hypothetical protein